MAPPRCIRWLAATLLLWVAAASSGLASEAHGAKAGERPRQTVAFRLDDVQDWWLSDVQQAVVELFAEYRIPLTLAVIGGSIGEDEALVERIRSRRPLLAFANHGLHARNGPDGRSMLVSQPAAVTRSELAAASAQIALLFDARPRVFIPHQNEYHAGVLEAASSLGFSHLSSGCMRHNGEAFCPDPCGQSAALPRCDQPDRQGLVHVPAGATTQLDPVVGKGTVPMERVLEEIDNSIAQYCFAVVMLHPQDFAAADETPSARHLATLRTLLRTLSARADAFELVTLDRIEARCP